MEGEGKRSGENIRKAETGRGGEKRVVERFWEMENGKEEKKRNGKVNREGKSRGRINRRGKEKWCVKGVRKNL